MAKESDSAGKCGCGSSQSKFESRKQGCPEKSSLGKESSKEQKKSSGKTKTECDCSNFNPKLESKKGQCSDKPEVKKEVDCKKQTKPSSSQPCGDSGSQSKSESKKDNLCADRSGFGKKSSSKDSDSTGKCGSSTSQGKGEGSGPDKSSLGKNKDCPAPRKTTKTCHSSQKQFQKDSERCPDEKSKKDDERCHGSRKNFQKSSEEKASGPCEKKDPSENKCKEFKTPKESDCSSSQQEKQKEPDCSSSQREKPKESKAKQSDCSSSQKEKPKESKAKQSDCSCSQKEKPKESRSSSKSPKESTGKGCGSSKSSGSPAKEGSAYSKISKFCKDLGKKYVKPKSESKCSSAEETISRNRLPITKPPCDPAAEQGIVISNKPACSTPKVICPETKTAQITEFFPLDARNTKLNECIEKYMKIDPSLVINKCSKFANKTSDMSEQCLKSLKKSQLKCVGTMPEATSLAVRRTSLLGPRHAQIAGRWAPTAGIYMATTFFLTVYVTEWKAILKHVPGFSSLAQESAPT